MEIRNKKIKSICVFTGSRAEYGILKPIMRAIKADKGFILSTVVYGMHIAKEFGETINYIREDGFKIDAKLDVTGQGDKNIDMAVYLGNIIKSSSKALEEINPDIVLVLGDRVDALGVTLAAAYMNIPIAHFHGGDISGGGLDEPARHSISKFAQIHFAASKESAARLIKMGEDAKRVHVIGAPGLESILKDDYVPAKIIAKKLNLNLNQPILLAIQHPVTTESKEAAMQMQKTMQAIDNLKYQTVLIYPNSDSGGREMIKVIKKYEGRDYLRVYKSLKHEEYLGLMKIASVMVGNSSSGIIEAASFHLPVVNIGTRQLGRQRVSNVIDVAYDVKKIENAIKKALFNNKFLLKVKTVRNPYGQGDSSKKVLGVLNKIRIDNDFLQKRTTY